MAEGLWNGDALHTRVELLELRSGPVGYYQCDDVADDGAKEAPKQTLVSGKVDDTANEGEVPVVPEVDIIRAGGAEQQHHDVHTQADGNDERAHRGTVCHSGGSRPSHVEGIQLQAINFSNLFQNRFQCLGQQTGDDTEADKTYTHKQTAFKGFSKFDTDAKT